MSELRVLLECHIKHFKALIAFLEDDLKSRPANEAHFQQVTKDLEWARKCLAQAEKSLTENG
jgi:hypothetical protein